MKMASFRRTSAVVVLVLAATASTAAGLCDYTRKGNRVVEGPTIAKFENKSPSGCWAQCEKTKGCNSAVSKDRTCWLKVRQPESAKFSPGYNTLYCTAAASKADSAKKGQSNSSSAGSSGTCRFTTVKDRDIPQGTVARFGGKDANACWELCERRQDCNTAIHKAGTCWLKRSSKASQKYAKGFNLLHCPPGSARKPDPSAFRSGRPQAQPVRVQLRASSPPLPAGVAADSGGARLQGSPRRVYGRGDRQKVIFRVLCTLLGNASLDPVISPGQKSAHVHAIVGPVSVGNTIDLANDFQPDVATTCNLKIDMSMYWVPALYQKRSDKNDKYYTVPLTSTHYYLDYGFGDFYAMPLGLQLYTGFGRGTWFCETEVGEGSTEEWSTIPPRYGRSGKPCKRVEVRLTFPHCWDGERLSSPDQSHAVFQDRGPCPESHPFRIPQLRSVYTWFIDMDSPYDIVLSNGDRTGARVHSDFVSGWPDDRFASMLGKCEDNAGPGCNAGRLSPEFITPEPSDLTFSKPQPSERIEPRDDIHTTQ